MCAWLDSLQYDKINSGKLVKLWILPTGIKTVRCCFFFSFGLITVTLSQSVDFFVEEENNHFNWVREFAFSSPGGQQGNRKIMFSSPNGQTHQLAIANTGTFGSRDGIAANK